MAIRMRMKFVIAGCAACLAFGGACGFAASFASGTSGLGAGSKVIASCGSAIEVDYTLAFSGADGGYSVDGIELSNIPTGCLGKSLAATFYDDTGTALGAAVGARLISSGTTQRIAVAGNAIDASRVSGVSVAVS